MKITALIPLRGGSKSIPLKNIKLIAGKPLFFWVVDAACQSGVFDEIIISTDSDLIIQEIRKYNFSNVIIDKRPDYLATDTSSTESVMLYIAEKYSFDILYTIQATSPLTDKDDFRDSLKLFLNSNYDAMLTGVRSKRFFWNDDGSPLNYNPECRPRRQDFRGSLIENGAFYITKRDIFEKEKCRLGGKIGIYEMSEKAIAEIDEPEDWCIVERELVNNKFEIDDIRLFACDVDGVLTDAGMYYDNTGNELKKFNTRDGKGIELIRKFGIKTAIITSEDTEIVKRRAEKLNIDYLFQGCNNKLDVIKKLLLDLSISKDQVVYIGDDLNDLDVIKYIKYSFCPNDAVDEIKQNCFYILSKSGGEGCAREVCDLIIEKCGAEND